MSQHDTLTQALQQIADWNSHTTEYAVDYGSNGVRDFYRNIARAALSATQPAQAAQSGNRPTPEWYARKIQETLDDDFAIGPAAVDEAQAAQPDGRGTDAQIEKERDIARHAIVGSLAAGYAGQSHPGADHWLAAAHEAGARIKDLEAQAAQGEPLPEHADHVPEIAARLRLVARLAGCADAIPEDDRTAVGCIFSVLGNMRRALELKQAAQAEREYPY